MKVITNQAINRSFIGLGVKLRLFEKNDIFFAKLYNNETNF